jgi:hypothetical protein
VSKGTGVTLSSELAFQTGHDITASKRPT